jgi:hypothetical protein
VRAVVLVRAWLKTTQTSAVSVSRVTEKTLNGGGLAPRTCVCAVKVDKF